MFCSCQIQTPFVSFLQSPLSPEPGEGRQPTGKDRMPTEAIETPLPPNLFARLALAARYAISGVSPDAWFGPQQPLAPQAPPEVKGRQFDYPFGVNLSYVPRATGGISFAELRALADALPLLRAVIETRKDQIAGLSYAVRARDPAGASDARARIRSALAFLARPDRRHSFSAWLRMLLEDMLVIDAATIYPRFTRAGALYSLDVIDGSTITPLIGEDGRSPEPPDPAYQQILHGVPAADFSSDELLYLPRNVRSHRLYGMSPVEQIALTVNIALRRDMATLDYYRAGSTPDAFATLPKEWTIDQIRQFQDYFDALMSGNSARRRMMKFMPSEFRLIEARQPPLKDQYDEWLARVICYAFSVPASAFVSQVNRATSETLRMQATQEGLVPLKAWIKGALDHVIQVYLNQPDLEFVWVGDDAIDPLQQAQTLNILVSAGIKTREEARADLGLAPEGGKAPAGGLGKFNPYHDPSNGQFTTAEAAGGARATQIHYIAPPKPPLSAEEKQARAQRVRDKIVGAAEKYIGSQAWVTQGSRGNFGDPSNKCNLFVYEVLTEAGASPGLPNGHFGGNPPEAGQWADPNYAIPGWRVLAPDEGPEPADVVAQQIGYSDASGHVMILGQNGTVIGTGRQGNGPEGTIEIIPMPEILTDHAELVRSPKVFRRWVGR